MRETLIQRLILKAWGNHPSLRLVRVNTGVGWFANGEPARKADRGAHPVRFNPPGTADLVGLIAPSGRMLMIEVKAAKGTQSEAQIIMQRVVTTFGGAYCVARSVEDVDAFMAGLGIYRA